MSSSIKKRWTLFGALIGIGTTLALVIGLGVLAGAGVAASAAAPTNTSPPTVKGTPQEGQKLTGDRGTWSGSPTDYNYFWMRCNKAGNACSSIGGALSFTTVVQFLSSASRWPAAENLPSCCSRWRAGNSSLTAESWTS